MSKIARWSITASAAAVVIASIVMIANGMTGAIMSLVVSLVALLAALSEHTGTGGD
jgi:hypothetical protein